MVDNLAAFGLAYVLIKFFMGIVEELKQVGVVLVQDRPGFHKILVCILVLASSVFLLSVIICKLSCICVHALIIPACLRGNVLTDSVKGMLKINDVYI